MDTVLVVVAAALVVTDHLVKVLALGVLPGNRKPSSAMAWLILILVIPLAGFVVFLFLGRTDVGGARLARQREADEAIRSATDRLAPADVTGPPYLDSIAALGRNLGSLPLQDGNHVELIAGYREAIAAMTQAVGTAASSVEVEFYIAAWDDVTGPFFEALVAAAERGVTVRLLLDHIGSRSIPGHRELIARLEGLPIQFHQMLPVRPLKGQFQRPDLRNHRKIVVVDGRVAFMGSQNLVEPGYNKPRNHQHGREYVDLVARIEGPTVNALRAVFAKDWYIESHERTGDDIRPETAPPHQDGVAGQVVPSGPGYATENNLRLFTALIYSAQSRVSLTSPYFVPDEPLLYAVTTAARRGVAVELFVSEWGDQFMVSHAQCSYYQALLEAGVRIHLYPPPWILHSKHFSIDDDVAVIGSSNMDMRSFALNYEVSLLLTGGDVVARFRAVEDGYRAMTRELTLDEWQQRSRGQRYLDNTMRLTAALQ
ncbi:Cardiolipin synthase A [Nocardioides aquaticus]|uniref:Cardiolipin synthase n=1 Tax=Nocardioides aquaticus TaxID=160826 RepID=A0ABX8ECT0_9ACTN|nr:cardiolipin synthase [Nocardioides aquaticus]QVT77827.1 Cardiolipin synthase A [Nocardioides aquaticus]